MLKKLCMRLIFTSFLFLSTVVDADVFHLQFNDQIFGGHQTVDLQNALREQYQVDANQISIEKIDVVVKSWFGGGQVWLGSRYNQADRRFVNGQANNFNNPADWTFNQIAFVINETNSDLQLNMNGQFRLREVIVSSTGNVESEDGMHSMRAAADILLPLYHMELNGLSSLDLKQLLQNDTQLNPDEYHLNSVTVAIKSSHDGAQVWLESGQQMSKVGIINGARQAFSSHDPGTYEFRSINAAKYGNESSPWLLNFNGDFRLYEIIVSLEQR